MTVAEVLAAWRADAEALQRCGCDREAGLLRRCAEELDHALAAQDDEALTLAEAAAVSGYSIPHLRRLLAEGALRNVGAGGPVRLRRGSLPRKPGTPASPIARQRTRSQIVTTP